MQKQSGTQIQSPASWRLPIETLPLGDIAPPLDPDHPTWGLLSGWDDAFAPWGGYKVTSCKTCVEDEGARALLFSAIVADRSLLTGQPHWREHALHCTLKPLDAETPPCDDALYSRQPRAGLVFRMETSRRHYFFCIESKTRLVLYRRIDDEWFILAERTFPRIDGIVTLQVELCGDGIHAACPELDVDVQVTDTWIRHGRAGFRSRGNCLLHALEISADPVQQRVNAATEREARNLTLALRAALPEAREVGGVDLLEGERLIGVSGYDDPSSFDFHSPGRHDLLLKTPSGMKALTWTGKTLWENSVLPLREVIASTDRQSDGSRRIYCMAGERQGETRVGAHGQVKRESTADELIVLHGKTGEVLARRTLPPESERSRIIKYGLSFETGCQKEPGAIDIVLKKDFGRGEYDVWAYDRQLQLRWQSRVMPPYGHANAVHLIDLNGDGRAEVLVGGTLLSADGEVIWVHDRMREMMDHATRMDQRGVPEHYDAVVAGNLDGLQPERPVAFLIGGNQGVYVVDALTGRTLSCHRIGHAQWAMPCKVRADLPGTQVMVGTRWNNFGILTLFSGRGDRLWSIQPDFILQGACPVQWVPEGPQHIWHNTTPDRMALYDGHGREALPLDAPRRLLAGRPPRSYKCISLRQSPEAPHLLGIQLNRRIHLYGNQEVRNNMKEET